MCKALKYPLAVHILSLSIYIRKFIIQGIFIVVGSADDLFSSSISSSSYWDRLTSKEENMDCRPSFGSTSLRVIICLEKDCII